MVISAVACVVGVALLALAWKPCVFEWWFRRSLEAQYEMEGHDPKSAGLGRRMRQMRWVLVGAACIVLALRTAGVVAAS